MFWFACGVWCSRCSLLGCGCDLLAVRDCALCSRCRAWPCDLFLLGRIVLYVFYIYIFISLYIVYYFTFYRVALWSRGRGRRGVVAVVVPFWSPCRCPLMRSCRVVAVVVALSRVISFCGVHRINNFFLFFYPLGLGRGGRRGRYPPGYI